jgi:hypothetical protein
MQFRNMLLLRELKPSTARSSLPMTFYATPPTGDPRGAPVPPALFPPGQTGFSAPFAPGYDRNKGKRKKTGGYVAPVYSSPHHPWIGAIYMHPMSGAPRGVSAFALGLLGPRPQAPPQRYPWHT